MTHFHLSTYHSSGDQAAREQNSYEAGFGNASALTLEGASALTLESEFPALTVGALGARTVEILGMYDRVWLQEHSWAVTMTEFGTHLSMMV